MANVSNSFNHIPTKVNVRGLRKLGGLSPCDRVEKTKTVLLWTIKIDLLGEGGIRTEVVTKEIMTVEMERVT